MFFTKWTLSGLGKPIFYAAFAESMSAGKATGLLKIPWPIEHVRVFSLLSDFPIKIPESRQESCGSETFFCINLRIFIFVFGCTYGTYAKKAEFGTLYFKKM